MVGTLKLVGDGSWPIAVSLPHWPHAIASAAGPTAPADGLCLTAVSYAADPFASAGLYEWLRVDADFQRHSLSIASGGHAARGDIGEQRVDIARQRDLHGPVVRRGLDRSRFESKRIAEPRQMEVARGEEATEAQCFVAWERGGRHARCIDIEQFAHAGLAK